MRVFFDLDGTLFDHKSAEKAGVIGFYHTHRKHFNLTPEEFYQLWCAISDEQFARFLKGEISFQGQRRERLKHVFNLTGTTLTDRGADLAFAQYAELYRQHWRLFTDVIPCLQAIQGRHQLGIISNGDLEQQEYKLQKLGIKQYFDIIITASSTGVAKPHRRIFAIACNQAGVNPKQAYYVGDDIETDIIACQKAGMQGIWLNRSQIPCVVRDVTVIHSLEALASKF